MILKIILFFVTLNLISSHIFAQPFNDANIKKLIAEFKKDERGPFQAIRWFCPDGTILLPKERCAQPGGIQHALHKDVVAKLADSRHIFFGQILAGTDMDTFLDEQNLNSRLKQYQLEKYLQRTDDGWIFRKARFYRGAIQIEDEERWGNDFLKKLFADTALINKQFFLLRQATKDIPHQVNNNSWDLIRSLSKTVADSFPQFMNIRIKIHGQPDESDLEKVREFQKRYQAALPEKVESQIAELVHLMESVYLQDVMSAIKSYSDKLREADLIKARLDNLISDYSQQQEKLKFLAVSEIVLLIRKELSQIQSPAQRLLLMDISIELENILFRDINMWQPDKLDDLLLKGFILAQASAGCGYIELWEWDYIKYILKSRSDEKSVNLGQLAKRVEYLRRAVEWGGAMVNTIYTPVVSLFSGIEPLSNGFIDDRIRSSILLPLGETAGKLADNVARLSKISNDVLNIRNQNSITGLNPGYALGELEILVENSEDIHFNPEKIYIFKYPPADMKPVAGILTVSAGNLVSHVQLLARNLGIPNAVISDENFNQLIAYSGKKVFYAVSPKGRVILKLAEQMNEEEKVLVKQRKRSEEKVSVPVKKIKLDENELVSLKKLRASDSGEICGPKAANLGQLKHMFPDRVVNGFIIPFAVFRNQMDSEMKGTGHSFWDFLQDTFNQAKTARQAGKSDAEVDELILIRLEQLRLAIKNIELSETLKSRITKRFVEEFGKSLGQISVFLRSDTNMEDLKDFSGAGLNLTVFNVLEEEKIWQAIRDVWASPFTERSYRWRQKFLLNPENVFPSILIIPGVNVDKSGVMITSGVTTGVRDDVTVAFSRGVGGAVEGQNAESYLLAATAKNYLLTPARENYYTVLEANGGTGKRKTHFNKAILTDNELIKLREFAETIRETLPGAPGVESNGPYDVELGFKDGKIWLFQVRPYVENKKAQSLNYLLNLDPVIPVTKQIELNSRIEE